MVVPCFSPEGAGYKVHVSPVQLDTANLQEARDSQQASAGQQAPDDQQQDEAVAPGLL